MPSVMRTSEHIQQCSHLLSISRGLNLGKYRQKCTNRQKIDENFYRIVRRIKVFDLKQKGPDFTSRTFSLKQVERIEILRPAETT